METSFAESFAQLPENCFLLTYFYFQKKSIVIRFCMLCFKLLNLYRDKMHQVSKKIVDISLPQAARNAIAVSVQKVSY